MCTETFLHLPEEKRIRFLEAAWEEFTTVSFEAASINQIVRRAGVPRGSFYQYFLDKRDLFFYLMELVRSHLTEEFREMVAQGGGDLFRTQLLCYDRFVQQGPSADLLFDRFIRVLQLNSWLHLQMMTMNHPDRCMLETIWDQLDLSDLRSRDKEFVRHIFFLALVALATAVKDTLASPEDAPLHREALRQRLSIIRCGSVIPAETSGGHSTKEATYV